MSIKGFVINGQTVKYNYPDLDNKPPQGTGVSDDLKTALLQLASKVAYIDDDGSNYYQDLYDALYTEPTYSVTNNLTDVTNSNTATRVSQGGSYSATLTAASRYSINSVAITMGGNDVTGTVYSSGTITIATVTGNIVITAVATERQATLTSIDAVFTQGQTIIYDTDSLNTLKQYLVVTAYYDDTTSETLSSSAYTLSGTLTTGTSTITVSYGGQSDTFTVTVTHADGSLYNWDFTSSLVDSKQSATATLGSGCTRSSSGLSFDGTTNGYAVLADLSSYASSSFTVEIDVTNIELNGSSSYNTLFVGFAKSGETNADYGVYGAHTTSYVMAKTSDWAGYTERGIDYEITNFENHTMKMQVNYASKLLTLYTDGAFATEFSLPLNRSNSRDILQIGTSANQRQLGNGTVVTAVRVYEGVV